MKVEQHIDRQALKGRRRTVNVLLFFLLLLGVGAYLLYRRYPFFGGAGLVILLIIYLFMRSLKPDLRHFERMVAVWERHPDYSLKELAIASRVFPGEVKSLLTRMASSGILRDFDLSTVPPEPEKAADNPALEADLKEMQALEGGSRILLGLVTVLVVAVLLAFPGDTLEVLASMGVIFGIFLIASWSSLYNGKLLRQSLSVMLEHPHFTFTQIAEVLHRSPLAVRGAFQRKEAQKALPGYIVDEAADRLVPKPIPREELATVPCPNCGAQVTVSTKLGGQCEYCDTWLPGTE